MILASKAPALVYNARHNITNFYLKILPTEVNCCLLTNLFRMVSQHSRHKSYESCVVAVMGAV